MAVQDLGAAIDGARVEAGVALMIEARAGADLDAKAGADFEAVHLEEAVASDREGVGIDLMEDRLQAHAPTNAAKTLARQEQAGVAAGRVIAAQAQAVHMTVQEAHKAAADSKLKKCFFCLSPFSTISF